MEAGDPSAVRFKGAVQALDFAEEGGHDEVVALLIEYENGRLRCM